MDRRTVDHLVEPLPPPRRKTGKIATSAPSFSSASPQSVSCSESYVIPHEVVRRSLRRARVRLPLSAKSRPHSECSPDVEARRLTISALATGAERAGRISMVDGSLRQVRVLQSIRLGPRCGDASSAVGEWARRRTGRQSTLAGDPAGEATAPVGSHPLRSSCAGFGFMARTLRERPPQTSTAPSTSLKPGTWSRRPEASQFVLASDDHNYGALYLLGGIYGEQGKFRDAASLLARAVKSIPTKPVAYYNLANVLDQCNRPREALTAITRTSLAFKITPTPISFVQ